PEMHGGVRPPWPPALRAPDEVACGKRSRAVRERLAETEVARGKGVGAAVAAQRDVVRGPRADARDRAEPRDDGVERRPGVERERPGARRRRERTDRRGPRAREPDAREVGVDERAGRREEM